MKIVLGVNDIPYGQSYGKDRGTTTGDVAGFLEDKYHVMEHFWELNQEGIEGAMVDAFSTSLASLLKGNPETETSAFGAAEATMESMFKNMLALKQLDELGYPGIPTAASLQGIQHRMQKVTKGPPRPSFIDTGQYEKSFVAEIKK